MAIPPNWEEARLHGQQSHIGRVVEPVGAGGFESSLVKLRPKKEKYPLCVRYQSIEEVGSGVPMLYQFKLWTMLVYLVILVPAVYSMIVNI